MKRSSEQIITTVLRDDDSVDPAVARAVVRQLKGKADQTDAPALLLTTAETTKLLGISRQTLWRLTKSGEIAAVKVRAGTRYRRFDVDSYISSLMPMCSRKEVSQ